MTELEKKIIALFEQEWEIDEDYTHFKVIEDSGWEDCTNYKIRALVVQFMDKYYQINESKTRGSYKEPFRHIKIIVEVSPVVKIIKTTVWEKV